MGLGGMNDERMDSKRNTGPKVECAHLMLWWSVTAAGIVKKSQWRRELVCPARKICEEERMKECYTAFISPGEVTQVEWHESLSLDKIYKFETPTAKTIPALNNNSKFYLSATRAPLTEWRWEAHDVRQ